MTRPTVTDEGIINGRPYVRVSGVGNFSTFKTFDCGQCFRFDPQEGADSYEVTGVAMGRRISFSDINGELIIKGTTAAEYDSIWERYLSLDADYDEIDRVVTTSLDADGCAVMTHALEVARGIRILRQDPWEALCSFIISQNNNIPRIKKIISALSASFGEKIDDSSYAFPTAKALADAGEDKIFALKTGFRASYITDAARRVASGELDLHAVCEAESYDKAAEMLMTVRGVGPKVAACALLFGFGFTEAFPIDTWMKKVAERHFPGGLDHKLFGKAAGIAQQYLFYMERYINSPERI